VRLENERLVTEAEIAKMNEEYEQHIRPTETLSTTAPRDAPISDVWDGVEQVRKTREQALASDSSSEQQIPPTGTVTPSPAATAAAAATVPSSANATSTSASTPAPATGRKNSERNRFALLRTFSRRAKSEETSNIQPYPGT
jgi:hypothetical protein